MAFNRTDTRQRAYCPIGAYNPAGNWVDEPAFNKHPGHHPGTKGILIGNWNEEEGLRQSMAHVEAHLPQSPLKKAEHEPKTGLRVVTVPTKQSSVYLTKSAFGEKLTTVSETHDVFRGSQVPKPAVGARTAAVLALIDDEVRGIEDKPEVQYPSSDWQTTQNLAHAAIPIKYPEPADASVATDAYLRMPAVTCHSYTYKHKLPYGATFATAARMDLTKVTINTSGEVASGSGNDEPHKKNANFSTPIQQFNKSASPRY